MSAALEAGVENRGGQPEEITYEEYLNGIGLESAETPTYEILDGILHMVQTPNWRHQRIVKKLARLLDDYENSAGVGYCGIAPFDIIIRRTPKLRTRQPDVFFISNERLMQNEVVLERGPLETAPELVVEVLSASETPRTLRGKLEDFRTAGVLECWVIAPNAETVQVLKLTADGIETEHTYSFGETVQSVAFPNLTMATADIFAE